MAGFPKMGRLMEGMFTPAPAAPVSLPFIQQGVWLWVLIALAVAHAAILLATPVPPLNDYPTHLARIHIMTSIGSSPDLQRFYEYHWALAPNLGADLLIFVLAHIMPIEFAGRLVVALIPGVTLLGVALVRWKVFGRIDSLVLLSAPFAMGVWFGWGFLNFCLTMGLALIAFAIWLSVRERPLLRLPVLLAAGFLVWTSHLVGWAVLGILVFVWEITAPQPGGNLARRLGSAVLRTAPLAAPLLVMLVNRSEQGALVLPAFDAAMWKGKIDAILSALVFTWDRADKYCVALIALIGAAAVGFRLVVLSPGLMLASLLLFLAFIVCPPMIFGSANADTRLLTPFFLVATSALSWRADKRGSLAALLVTALTVAAVAVAGSRLAYSGARIAGYSPELVRTFDLANQLPQGARVLVVTVNFLSGGRPPIAHAASIAVVRRDALTNTHFEEDRGQPLHIRYLDTIPPLPSREGLVFEPAGPGGAGGLSDFIARAPLESFDYLWIQHSHLAPAPDDPRLERLASTERAALYRVVTAR